MMKNVKLLGCFLGFLLIAFSTKAQDYNHKLEIFYAGLGENDVSRFNELDGAAGYHGENHFSLGVSYLQPLSKAFDFEMGLSFAQHEVTVVPNVPPNVDVASHSEDISLLTFPFAMRLHFLHYFYLKGGVLFDVDLSDNTVDPQTGLGATAALGFNYDFKCPFSVFVSPYASIHSLLPFSQSDNQQHVFDNGVVFGIGYRF